MDLHINWLAVALATLSTMVVGTVWYLPKVFGNRWQALTGVDPNKPKSRVAAYGGSFVASAITAIVLAGATYVASAHFGTPFLGAALLTAVSLWAGFTATRILVHELFESRPISIWLITAAYELVTVLVMAVIIGLLN
ncbi:MAG: DUF1761 domain-containing protein [Pseudolysinimonas sp.]